MTERDWETCTEPQQMLMYLRESGGASGRKLRLFGVACVRRAWGWLEDARSEGAVEVAERYTDGRATAEELADACEAAQRVALDLYVNQPGGWTAGSPLLSCYYATTATWLVAVGPGRERGVDECVWDAVDWAARAVVNAADHAGEWEVSQEAYAAAVQREQAAEELVQAALLRDIFGNPHRPLPLLPPSVLAFNDGLVVRLVAAAYEQRSLPDGHLDPHRLAVLADALEDAGCTDAGLPGHLRGAGVHVRGCWAVDLVLGQI